MPSKQSGRRKFLKSAGLAGVTGFAIGARVPASRAQGAKESEHPAIYDVRAFGATGDGKKLDTPAINRAIEEAAAAGEARFTCEPAIIFATRFI